MSENDRPDEDNWTTRTWQQAEELEGYIERLETLVTSMQTRIEKLEKEQDAAAKSAPFHLGLPMREFAERPPVGFRWLEVTPMEPRV